MGLIKWCKDNHKAILAVGGLLTIISTALWIINLLGFSTSPQHYLGAWKAMNPDSKINFVLVFNLIFTILTAVLIILIRSKETRRGTENLTIGPRNV
jgi:hypothetical protein